MPEPKQHGEHSNSSPVVCASTERHYTVAEIAAMWNLSKDTVRRLFQTNLGFWFWAMPVRGDESERTQHCAYRNPSWSGCIRVVYLSVIR